MRPLRLVPDNTHIRFMRGRLAGPIVSAVLSIASVILFFWPGVNYGIDFRGGTVVELRTAAARRSRRAAQRVRGASARRGEAAGVRLAPRRARDPRRERAEREAARRDIQAMLASRFPGSEIRDFEVVGARVSEELFRHGLEASAAALARSCSTSGSASIGNTAWASS